MYNDSSLTLAVVPPMAAGATITMLPATGSDMVTSVAATVFVALMAWGGVYIYKMLRTQ